MDSTTPQRVVVPENLRALYTPVAQQLEEVESLLRKELSSNNPFVDRLAKHGFRLGGKRLRPALVLLSGEACGGLRPAHLPLAAMTEILHTATLVHDDVLDEATIRRHLDTINARWDNEASILLGDYLFARAMCLAGSINDVFASRLISESSRDICEGELKQIHNRGNYNLNESEYFEIIAGKTAALTSCCCRLGAYYAGVEPAVCDALAQYGRYLGMAFQIADDVLDVSGNEAVVGKSLGTDLVKQKATLPLIWLLENVNPEDRTQLTATLMREGNHHRNALQPWFERYDAIGYAKEKAKEFSDRACNALKELPDTAAKHSLLGIADFVVTRHQ
jgi:octaprenyl-diphosphate synthase